MPFYVHALMFLQRKYSEEKILNDRLTGEISELRQEVLVIQEIPRRLYESVVSSKDFYEDLLCSMKVKLVHYSRNVQFFSSDIQRTDIYFLSFCMWIRALQLMGNLPLPKSLLASVKLAPAFSQLWKPISWWQWMVTSLSPTMIL